MKKVKFLATALVMSATMLLGSVSAFAAAKGGKEFLTWFEEEAVWRSVSLANPRAEVSEAFITDTKGRPSDKDIDAIMSFASKAVTSGGRTDWYMVVVKDTDEQNEIIGWADADKTIPKCTSDGTVTVLVFSERVLVDWARTDNTVGFQPDRGYYDAGIVTGYLNVAAITMGYGTHMFMTPAIPGPNGFNNGGRGLEVKKYLADTTYTNGATEESFSTENMKFVCAVVIGTPDTEFPVETLTTQRLFPENWSVWEPADEAKDKK